MPNEVYFAIGGGVVACAAIFVWSAWRFDRAEKRQAENLRESGDQQRKYRELLEQSAEQQKRSEVLIDREEALVTAVEQLVRRLESRL